MENKMKRTSDFNHFLNFESKKLRREFDEERTLITSIENMSNELFYEIFDYLDIFDIYEIFSNLNNRFQRLLTSSSFLLKIKLSSNSNTNLEHFCKQIIIPNRNRIISIHLWDKVLVKNFFAQCTINSSFTCLKSIVINGISKYGLLMFLFYLTSLSELSSLTINFDETPDKDLGDIYHMIFHLRALKYLKLSFPTDIDSYYFESITSNEYFNSLKYVVIGHPCTISNLMSMLYHLPQLCHLFCQILIKPENDVENELTFTHPSLEYFCVDECDVDFDDFERFIKNISFHLKTFRINIITDPTYIDVNRWEQFIARYMPNLRTFYFKYTSDAETYFTDINLYRPISQSNSPFWAERGWYLNIETDSNVIIYSVCSSRKKWLDFWKYTNVITSNKKKDDKLTIRSYSNVQLTINNLYRDTWDENFIDVIKSMFSTIQFTSLELDSENILMCMLMETLRMLPYLDSLKVLSFPLIQLSNLSNKDAATLLLVSNYNKITKICFEKLINFEQLHFLLTLCPRIQHLQVSFANDNNFMKILQLILTKKPMQNLDFCSLYLHIPCINKKMIHPIQSMIDSGNLLTNYTIKHIPDHIILQWK